LEIRDGTIWITKARNCPKSPPHHLEGLPKQDEEANAVEEW
jgi:hypothetical protein